MEAADGDVPPRTTVKIVTVSVDRNLESPVFKKPEGSAHTASVGIRETENFERVIYKVEASDADRRVRHNKLIILIVYSMVCERLSDIRSYFRIIFINWILFPNVSNSCKCFHRASSLCYLHWLMYSFG